jgi:hypothetical protein
MKKMLLMFIMIAALTVSCASTGSENDAKSNTGENIPAGAIEAEEMAPGGAHP